MKKSPLRVFVSVLTLGLLGITLAKGYEVHQVSSAKALSSENWGLGFGEEGKAPTANQTAEELKQYEAYYIGDENEKKISDLELQNNVLTRQANESENELSALKESNQAIVFENAEKIKALESECAAVRLNSRKEMKLYSYYIDRAELTVAELTKQMEQIKQSIENSEL